MCPAAQWDSAQPIGCRMTFLSQCNGATVCPETLRHVAPGKRLTSPATPLWYSPCMCVWGGCGCATFTQNLAPLFSKGTNFFREESCQFFNIILQPEGHLSCFPHFDFALSQFQFAVLIQTSRRRSFPHSCFSRGEGTFSPPSLLPPSGSAFLPSRIRHFLNIVL